MLYKKFQTFAQIVGFVTIGLLAVLGLLSLFNGGNLALAALGLAQAAPQTTAPQVMNYQGILKDAAGDPLNGTYTITFRIYDSEIGGTALWEETHANVTVREGHFNVLLGYSTPLPDTLFSQPDRYIGVTVEPYTEMTPRQRIASVPYAFYADSAFQAEHTDRAYGLSAPDGDPVDAVTVDNAGHVTVGDGSTSANVKIPKGGLCIDSDGACTSDDGELRVGAGGIRGTDSSNQDLYLVPSGNVGIGTTSPDRPLTIQGTGEHSEWVSFKDANGTTQWHLNYQDIGLDFVETGVAKGRLFLKDGGNVGIGTTSPQAKLDVNGDINWSGHLMNMTVTSEWSISVGSSDDDGVVTTTLVSEANSICFLVGIKSNDIDSSDEFAACYIDQSSGNWELIARIKQGDDNFVRCEARCLQW